LDTGVKPVYPQDKPAVENRLVEGTGLEASTRQARPKRRIGLSAPKKARITLSQGPREAAKNIRILSGLERAYGAEKAKSILEQAVSIFHVANPHAENNPELYELFENGQIDQALEMFGTSWVIGRPRID